MFCFRGNVKCVACGISGGVRCTDCTGVLKEGLGNNVSIACQLTQFYITKERVWEKNWPVLQGEVKGITDSGSSAGKQCGKFSSQIIFNKGTHTCTHNSSQNTFPYTPQ